MDDFSGHGQLFYKRKETTPMTVFQSRLNGSSSKSFLTVQTMDINVNTDPKRFRCSGVDTTSNRESLSEVKLDICNSLVDHVKPGSIAMKTY